MRVLDREPVRALGQQRSTLGIGQRSGEVGRLAGRCGIGAHAVDQIDGIGGQIMHAGTCALVGVGDGTAHLQAPFAGGADRAIDAARENDGAVTMRVVLLNVLGTRTSIVTFWLPLPSSAYARYSVPAIFPSPLVTLPAASMNSP
jgi:hypothetical protein